MHLTKYEVNEKTAQPDLVIRLNLEAGRRTCRSSQVRPVIGHQQSGLNRNLQTYLYTVSLLAAVYARSVGTSEHSGTDHLLQGAQAVQGMDGWYFNGNIEFIQYLHTCTKFCEIPFETSCSQSQVSISLSCIYRTPPVPSPMFLLHVDDSWNTGMDGLQVFARVSS